MTAPVSRVTIAELQAAHVTRQEEWCPDQKPDLSFRGNEMAGEVGEACNVIKKLERERHGWRGSRDTLDHLGEELADVVHTAVLCAITAGIDLAPFVVSKFNSTSEKNGLSTLLALDSGTGGQQPVASEFSAHIWPTRQGFKHPDGGDKMLRLWVGRTSEGQEFRLLSFGMYCSIKMQGFDYTPVATDALDPVPADVHERIEAVNALMNGVSIPTEPKAGVVSEDMVDMAITTYCGTESNDMRDMMRAALTVTLNGGKPTDGH